MTQRGQLMAALAAAASSLTLEAKIIAEYSAVGWTTYCIFLARLADLNLASGDADVWTNHGNAGAGNATQGTSTARPTWNVTGLNGKGILEHDGGDYMRTPTFDVQSETACVLTVLYSDSRVSGWSVPVEYGKIASGDTGIMIQTFNTEPYLRTAAGVGTVNARTVNGAAFGMDSEDVVSASWDSARASEECSIRHAGADVTDSYPANGNTASMFSADYYLNIGGRYTGGGLTGNVAAVVLAAGNSAVPTARVANVEALLGAEWSV